MFECFAGIYMYVNHVYALSHGAREGGRSSEPGVPDSVSCHVVAGNWTQALGKSNSGPLGHLPSHGG